MTISNAQRSVTIFTRQRTRILWILCVLLAGTVLRLNVALAGDPLAEYTASGGDSAWYLANGEGLLSGQQTGIARGGISYDNSVVPVPPGILLFVGIPQRLFAPDVAIIVIRLMQVAMSLGIAWGASRMAWHLTHSQPAALFVLTALCLDPSQVLEPRNLNTETLYIFLIVMALWALIVWVMVPQRPRAWGIVLVAVLLGMATLTRAVSLLFPLALIVLLAWAWRGQWRRWLMVSGALLTIYAAVVGTWTVYNVVRYDRFVIASTQLFAAIWRGAITTDGSPAVNDALLGVDPTPGSCTVNCGVQPSDSTFITQASATISGDPLGYVTNRLRELGQAVLQPHATTTLGGESLRDLLATWARGGWRGDDFGRLIQGENFGLKLLIYAFQMAGYGLAVVGVWRARHNGRIGGVPLAFIGYTLAIHLVLLVLPRYLFPIMPCVWVLAGGIFRAQEPETS